MNKFKKIYCGASFVFACIVIVFTITLSFANPVTTYAASSKSGKSTQSDNRDVADALGDNTNGLSITYNNDSGSISTPVRMLLILTVLTLAPSILIMMTSFTRIIIVLHFVRTAIGTQTAPPNQILIGLALFLTFFIMWPTFQKINTNAIQPLDKGEITQSEFWQEAEKPIREFMIKDAKIQIRDVNLFAEISVGSLLYIKNADANEIAVGDPITFYLDDNTLVTHRVVEIDKKNQTYTTKGDANEKEDGSPVSFDKVLGKPVFNIPQLGYLADKISQTSGKIIYVVAIIVDVILMYMGDLIWSTEQSKNEEKKDESAEK